MSSDDKDQKIAELEVELAKIREDYGWVCVRLEDARRDIRILNQEIERLKVRQ